MTKIPLAQSAAQSVSLGDRLEAALEAIAIGDRWATHRRGAADQTWQGGLLRVAQACAEGERLQPQIWQSHFQGLRDPAAVLINALPYLWINADAHGHHRAAVGRWVADLALRDEVARACDQLFLVLCREIANASHHALPAGLAARYSLDRGSVLGRSLDLAAQSQGQVALVLALTHQRGGATAEIALAGGLLGLTQGRASLGAGLRQRWLVGYCAPDGALDGAPGPDPWLGLEDDTLGKMAAALHRRWAGLGVGHSLEQPTFPLGIRV
ncbi:MAG: hypothetical protein ACFCVB_21625 [Nodosilinea sp.]